MQIVLKQALDVSEKKIIGSNFWARLIVFFNSRVNVYFRGMTFRSAKLDRAEANGGLRAEHPPHPPGRPFDGNFILFSDFVEFECLLLEDFVEK